MRLVCVVQEHDLDPLRKQLKLSGTKFLEGRSKLLNVYLLLTELEVRTVSYGPSSFLFNLWPKREVCGHKQKRKKRGSVSYSMDREDEVSKIFIISLLCI